MGMTRTMGYTRTISERFVRVLSQAACGVGNVSSARAFWI